MQMRVRRGAGPYVTRAAVRRVMSARIDRIARVSRTYSRVSIIAARAAGRREADSGNSTSNYRKVTKHTSLIIPDKIYTRPWRLYPWYPSRRTPLPPFFALCPPHLAPRTLYNLQ